MQKFNSSILKYKNPATGEFEGFPLSVGKSAYEIALEHGFEGSEEEWVDSLKVETNQNFIELQNAVNNAANKLDGIEDGANNYVHPSSHAATMITTDSNHRFVTDSEKSTWNSKAGNSVATTSDAGLMSASDKEKLDGIAAGANNTVVDTALSSSSTNPVQNKVINSALEGKVPTSRNVNGKALTSDITLSASDVNADASGSAATALTQANTYTDTKIAELVDSAPETMNTLNEVATAIKEHQDVTDALNAAIGSKASKDVATTTADGLMSKADKIKLNGIAEGANNYVHPSSHAASMITEDSTHRFVTDTEKTTWNSLSSLSIKSSTGANSIVSGMLEDRVTSTTTYPANSATAEFARAGGGSTSASGTMAVAEGYMTTASGMASTAIGYQTTANGSGAFSYGKETVAKGTGSRAAGYQTTAIGDYSTVEGHRTHAFGDASYASGISDKNIKDTVLASGTTKDTLLSDWETAFANSSNSDLFNAALGTYTHTEGRSTVAYGTTSHAEGSFTLAKGTASHTEGFATKTKADYAHAEGFNTIAGSAKQHVQGEFNIEDSAGTYAHIVGNGSDTGRSNAHTLDWDGNAWYAGDVYVGGTSQADAKKLTDVATTSSNGLMSAADKEKLDGIAEGANNYVHPSSHAASMITEDSTHRFVTDTEKTTWNSVLDLTGETVKVKNDALNIFTAYTVEVEVEEIIYPETEVQSSYYNDDYGYYVELPIGAEMFTPDEWIYLVIDGKVSKHQVEDWDGLYYIGVDEYLDMEIYPEDLDEGGYGDGVTDAFFLNDTAPTTHTIKLYRKVTKETQQFDPKFVDTYTRSQIDSMVFITVDDIDEICGATIQVANNSEVTF